MPLVFIDGVKADAVREGEFLSVSLTVKGGRTVEVRVGPRDTDPRFRRGTQTLLHRSKVRLRRHLCEFRDNYLDTSRLGQTIASTIRGTSKYFRILWSVVLVSTSPTIPITELFGA
jgi:hypothetical protein